MTDITLLAPLAGWAMPLAEVPDPVFAQGMMGDGAAIDPTGDTLHAPCAGTILTIHDARHAITLATEDGVELLMHIGIDSVAMAGDGFTALVKAGDRVATGDPLIRFDLDRLVTRASAAATPLIVVGEDSHVTWRHAGGMVAVGELVLRIERTAREAGAASGGPTLARRVRVDLPHGLHARPAARIVAALRALDADATLELGDKRASAASSITMLGLGLSHGAEPTIIATGKDAAAAIDAIEALLAHEVEAPVATSVPAPAPSLARPEAAIPGVAAAPGLAIGSAHWLRRIRPEPPARGDGVATERERLTTGIAAVSAELDEAAQRPGATAGIFGAHREILDDPTLLTAAITAIEAGDSAAAAIMAATESQAAGLRQSGDARIAERADDIVDVGERVAHAILGTHGGQAAPPAGAIVLADDLLPSQFAALDAAGVAGVALVRGGPTAHVAILAAGAGLPMAVALGEALESIADAVPVLLDGDAGFVVASPDAALRGHADATIARRHAAEARARDIGSASVATADGIAIAVHVNCGSAADAAAGMAAGADGCGLLRTEFLFLDRDAAPDVAEQTKAYRAVLDALPDRPVTIRLLDVGGDKPAPYLALPSEENPALGLRGIRVALARPDILEAQVAAILALNDDTHARIMVPMVASASEVAAVRAVLDRVRGDRTISLGAMIETPAAAIGADLIAREADFLSIGSNDLTQYTLAADRGNAGVAGMLDGLHPAVLRLIGETCARAGSTPVSVCGGLAADPLAAPILIGLGVRTLSVPPSRVPATKALVTAITLAAATDHARTALACAAATEVRDLARRFAEENGR
ncbi:MAG: phosphoenolpyruvate--protein phosphotransferase [Sphingomonas sp.]|uniref:phosphoenolpyruvate--protein phosphotransferase n=1 Tax=Sphingomonas sp. TaxID=28214 RepID=UPI001AD3E156|nr:phosphoenolpyruvate--protein phosphotransferase [Sphingomonas sp.]MBN8806806.1 phosphoenolpyruvate--protein phosphotransferase [Sphingomonas sp.]